MTGLNDNLSIVFKPVKTFTKKQLKGLDKYDLAEIDLKAEEESKLTKKQFAQMESHKEVPALINYFENETRQSQSSTGVKKRITLKKEDGRVVGLDDYENNIFW